MNIALYFGMLGRPGHAMHGLPSPNRYCPEHAGLLGELAPKTLPVHARPT